MAQPAQTLQIGQNFYTLVQRLSSRPAGTNAVVAATSTIEVDAPAVVIQLARGQAVRILLMGALFSNAAAAPTLNLQHANFSLTVNATSGIAMVFEGAGGPGGVLSTGGKAVAISELTFAYSDFIELGSIGTLTFFPIADVTNTGAVAQTVGMQSFALWELYNLNLVGRIGL